MSIINNQSILLGDDLKEILNDKSKLNIVASCFSIYAFDAMKDELKDIEEVRFIFSSPTFIEDKIADKIKKESREFYIPNEVRENTLYGTPFEIKLKNKLTQKAVAKECAGWIREKVKFKSNVSTQRYSNYIDVQNESGDSVYNPVDSFTVSELGYEKDLMSFRIINRIDEKDEPSTTNMILKQFNSMWNDSHNFDDVTDKIVEYITTAYKENSPEYVYYIILYNIFKDYLKDMSEDYMPNELTGFKDTVIWDKLYNYQKDAVIGIINKLQKYNGCILADSVGLGKTFTALAVMKYYDLKNKSILVLCPKRLSDNWTRYMANNKTNIFYKDRIHYEVLYHTDLGRTSGNRNNRNFSDIYWENYDLIVIDESHNFRNNNKFNDRETRYQFLLNKVIKPGVRTKVLMLSATPVNNRFKDLQNQLALAYGDDIEKFEEKLDVEESINIIFSKAQRVYNEWIKIPPDKRKGRMLLDKLDIDFSILLDSVTIARSRKHIVKYYDTNDIGNFPRRKIPVPVYSGLSTKANSIEYDEIYKCLSDLSLGVYAPMSYVLHSRISKYERLYDTKVNGRGTLDQKTRERSLQKLMTIMMLKRLESSVESFRLTINKILLVNLNMLEEIIKYQEHGVQQSYDSFSILSESDIEELNEDSDNFTTNGKIKIELKDMDIISWKRDIEKDIKTLKYLISEMDKITVDYDEKLKKLIEIIDDKIKHPFNENNKKILIFSAYADTASYLYDFLSAYIKERYNLETAKVEGGAGGNKCTIKGITDMDKILTFFSPKSKEKDLLYKDEKGEISVLVGTDCISEGQNLQDCDICINYDIHWNPVRIVQRFGRIDRIGSQNESIQLVNFWPAITLDEYINLKDRVMGRMTIADAVGTADDNPISDDQLNADYRKIQIQKLQNGELQDLDDVDEGINITDMGLNDFRIDMSEYVKSNGEPINVPYGLHAVIKEDINLGIEKGVIYVLKINIETNKSKDNILSPYYLVYVKDDGEIKYTYLNVKQTLDILRSSCKNIDKPIKEVCRKFNRETKDGFKMDRYSNLLEKAVESIEEVKETSDLKDFFTKGSEVLYQEKIKGLDDFTLIAFVVIR